VLLGGSVVVLLATVVAGNGVVDGVETFWPGAVVGTTPPGEPEGT